MKTNNSSIKKSIYLLKKNECVGIPTETVYGLAANAYSSKAILKVLPLDAVKLCVPTKISCLKLLQIADVIAMF